ncbi:hypothetical protein J8M20_17035 [Pseudoalteromonas luteoviolacea]|uniref:HEAT repeat domain-containing protein n=1 Tax=Pseudoalteromonas luteoviolacea TaxID=43657 RepID=UPI001B35FEDF|nr:hypothetical protein [Pseudoalteromonas luteoviolacea]MBQ4813070.1 hypothetical protein [Pseudoalteromonas luteoviolacea]
MPLLLCLVFLFSAATKPALAQEAYLQADVSWYDAQTRQLSRSAADVTIKKKQSKFLFLPAGQWLSVEPSTLEKVEFWQGQTFYALSHINKDLWLCRKNSCQLPASERARAIKLSNTTINPIQINVWRGHQHNHRDPFRRAVRLPLPGKTVALAQEHNVLYPLSNAQSVKVFFKHAKKLKLTVHRDLYDLSEGGKVFALVNDNPVSIINVSGAQAQEYTRHKLGVANVDYFTIPANSYLTLQSHTKTWVKLEQMHRGIFDVDAAIKQQENLFNPHWVNNLDERLTDIYLNHDISSLVQFRPEQATPLALRRYQDLLSTVSTGSYLSPISPSNQSIAIHRRIVPIYQPLREAKQQVFQSHTNNTLLFTRLKKSLHFDLTQEQRVTPWALLYIRSNKNTTLVVDVDGKRSQVAIDARQGFVPLQIDVDMDAKQISVFSASKANIDIAVQIRTLLPLPNSELLYAQPKNLSEKSVVTNKLLAQIQQTKSDSYLNSLSLFKIPSSTGSELPADPTQQSSVALSHWRYQLGEIEYLAKRSPTEALPKLRALVNSSFPEIRLRAWQLRLEILSRLNQENAVLRYLAALLQQPDRLLSDFAANELLKRYQQSNQVFNIQGLCALKASLKGCPELVRSTLFAQGKFLETLWLDHDTKLFSQYSHRLYQGLGYASYTELSQEDQPNYDLNYFEQVQLVGDTATYKAFKIGKSPLTLTAHSPLNVKINARVEGQSYAENAIKWLHVDKENNNYFMPLFSDVLSTTSVKTPGDESALSIASSSMITLKAGDTLTLSSSASVYLQLQIFDAAHFDPYSTQQLSKFELGTPFMDLLHQQPGTNLDSLTTLLNNALYRLENNTLEDYEFTALFSKLSTLEVPSQLAKLHDRVQSFGHWVPIEQYLNYAGTQLIDLSALESRSIAEQISRHTSQVYNAKGLTIRPYHTLSLDFSALQSLQTRLVFHFSDAELISNAAALVSIETGNGKAVWPITNNMSTFGLKQSELGNGTVKVRWLNPYLSQVLQVEVQVLNQNDWQNIELDQRQLFYYASNTQPVSAALAKDALVKVEYIKDNLRREAIDFYPAGIITIPNSYSKLARLFSWQLNLNRQKIAVAPPVTPIPLKRPKLRFDRLARHFNTPLISANGNQTHVEGFVSYDRDGIFQTSEPIDTAHRLDIGMRLRNRFKQNWYLLEGAYRINNLRYESLTLNGVYNWLDDDTPWYTEVGLYNRWQETTASSETHLTSHIDVTLGQIWRDDTSVRHQWWWQPYYYYTSIDKQEYLDDPLISQDMYNFYRAQHMHGWQAGYRIRYQPWVDSQFNGQVSAVSNEDWTSLDTVTFSGSWQQYYKGHIFNVGLSSSYVFADDHRPNATWQYLTSIGWQTLFDFSEHTAGWISLNWTQDWFRNNHNVRFEVTLGNLQNTGFAPFAHDEIIFESLQLTHFLEQDINGR